MARPRLGDGKTERVHLVITDSEIEAIEAWRFRNHVQSKSEAIRKLCQIGIDLENSARPIVDALDGLNEALSRGEATPEHLAPLYELLGPLLVARLGIRSMSDMQMEVDQSPALAALWRAANSNDDGGSKK